MEVMIDLETLDNQPSAVVLSIGLVAFDFETGEVAAPVTLLPSLVQQEAAGRTIGSDTVAWWVRQSEAARQAAFAEEGRKHVTTVLVQEVGWWIERAQPLGVWGNGVDFDCVILQSLYRSFEMECPFKFWQHRCYRTLRSLIADNYCDGADRGV